MIMDMRLFDLGLVEYEAGLELQKTLHARVKAGACGSSLVLCRHFPVITLGRKTKPGWLRCGEHRLRASGIRVVECDRGGEVTYHGPGQQMIYPIFDLALFRNDLHAFLRGLERAVIGVLDALGIQCHARAGLTGVWHEGKKISSIGIGVRNWVSYHGISINILKDDLANYSLIRPCGMDIQMTSAETILGRRPDFGELAGIIQRRLCHDQSYLA
jgi:lipoate-protein ligase B